MNAVQRFLVAVVEALDRAPWWRGECVVWGQRMRAASFERWLYLRMHRLGRMGGEERAVLGRLIRPGMTVVDVGSNLGLYTVLVSRLAGASGRVLAFEPDPALAGLLAKNCAANGCANVTVRAIALGRRRERTTLYTLLVNSGDNHLGDGGGRTMRRSVEVEVAPLDEVAPGLVPDLVKIDVQGWELEVLRGMDALLARSPNVVVYLECWPAGFRRAGYTTEDVVAFLSERGFTLYRAPTLERLDAAGLAALTARLTGWAHADLVASRAPLVVTAAS